MIVEVSTVEGQELETEFPGRKFADLRSRVALNLKVSSFTKLDQPPLLLFLSLKKCLPSSTNL
jgi:hypothetical protein